MHEIQQFYTFDLTKNNVSDTALKNARSINFDLTFLWLCLQQQTQMHIHIPLLRFSCFPGPRWPALIASSGAGPPRSQWDGSD